MDVVPDHLIFGICRTDSAFSDRWGCPIRSSSVLHPSELSSLSLQVSDKLLSYVAVLTLPESILLLGYKVQAAHSDA